MKKLEFHPLADIFPLIQDQVFIELTEDIKQNGLNNPIVLFEDKILDGRNRYRACLEAEEKPEFKVFVGDEDAALAFVVSANVHRRHMSVGQRAMVAAKIANLSEGRPKSKTSGIPLVSQDEAAEKMNVSVDSVKGAKKILEEAPKKTVKEVESGEKSINGALKEIKEKAKKKETVIDKTGYPIPEELVPLWNRGQEVQGMISAISKIKGIVTKAQEDEDVLYRSVNFSATLTHLENSSRAIKNALPFAVCWTCQGRNSKKCAGVCKGTGLVSKFAWESFCPKEIKVIRCNR